MHIFGVPLILELKYFMNNPFPYSDDNKRYHTQNYFLNHKFGKKVIKLSLNCGFSCPNRDGLKGHGGCIYCSASGSGDFGGNPADDIITQLEKQKKMMSSKWNEGYYIPYFQAGTNTYAPDDVLIPLYEKALEFENTVGIAIATRADCISDSMTDYFEKLSQRTYLTIELGLQTIHDSTAEMINRCHTYNDFLVTYNKLKEKNINVCIHLINGLPYETESMMMESAQAVAALHPHSIKFHKLHIVEDSPLAEIYRRDNFPIMSREEYINLLCSQLEIIPQDIVIQRVTGDGNKDTLIAPLWTLKKFVVMNELDKEFVRRNSYQGAKQAEPALQKMRSYRE